MDFVADGKEFQPFPVWPKDCSFVAKVMVLARNEREL
jgi:hypothetical protein